MDIKEIKPVTVSEVKVIDGESVSEDKVTDHIIDEIITKTVTDGVTGEVITYKEINSFKVSDLKRDIEGMNWEITSLTNEIAQLTERLTNCQARQDALKAKLVEAEAEVLKQFPVEQLPENGEVVPK